MTFMVRNNNIVRFTSYSGLCYCYEHIFIDNIDSIRAEFPWLESNLPSYSMDSIMSRCTASLVFRSFDCNSW